MITPETIRQKRAEYAALREHLIDQTNAITGKIDLCDELLAAAAQPADSAPNKPETP